MLFAKEARLRGIQTRIDGILEQVEMLMEGVAAGNLGPDGISDDNREEYVKGVVMQLKQ